MTKLAILTFPSRGDLCLQLNEITDPPLTRSYDKSIKNARIKVLIILFLLLVSGLAFGQDEFKPSIIPPDPDAASLGEYGDISLNYSTGANMISIPLHDFQYKDISVPISLSYNGSGIKTTQQSTWVGLGWTLNAGGLITKTVKGQDDLASGTYQVPPQSVLDKLSYGTALTGSDLDFVQDLLTGNKDGEPDIYFYNFGNYSGKFIYTSDGFICLNNDHLKIEHPGSSTWYVTTPDGFEYKFNVTETTEPAGYTETASYTSSWYLGKITSPKGYEITFNYSSPGLLYTGDGKSETFTVDIGRTTGLPTQVNSPTNYFTHSKVGKKYLSSITCSMGSVVFTSTSDRTDFKTGAGLVAAKRLTKITIEGEAGSSNLDKEITFQNNTYFDNGGSGYDNKRLKLAGILIGDQIYAFDYHHETNLPSILSEGQDHWGYYNGGSELSPSYSISNYSLDDSNRDTNPSTCDYGLLKTIYYPTGGKTEYDYECHDYSFIGNSAVNEPRYETENISTNYFGGGIDYSDCFTIGPNVEEVTLDAVFDYSGAVPENKDFRLELFKVGAVCPEEICCNIPSPADDLIYTYYYNSSLPQELTGLNGTYYLKLTANSSSTSIYSDVDITRLDGYDHVKLAGGARLKESRTYNESQVFTRKFTYQDPSDPTLSSGVLGFRPEYLINRTVYYPPMTSTGQGIVYFPDDYDCTGFSFGGSSYPTSFLQISSNPVVLGGTFGDLLNYAYVKEEHFSGGISNGTVERYYTTANPFFDDAIAFPSNVGDNRDMHRGQLLKEVYRDNSGDTVRVIENEYDNHLFPKNYWGIKLVSEYTGEAIGGDWSQTATSLDPCVLRSAIYPVNIGKSLIEKTTITDFPSVYGATVPKVDITEYQYGGKDREGASLMYNHVFVTNESINSGLESINYYYPYDNPSSYGANISSHMISEPYKTEKYRNSTFVYGSEITYKIENTHPVYDLIKISHGGAYETYYDFDTYNGYDEPTRIIGIDGIQKDFNWNTIDAGPTQSSLPLGHVTNYTYNRAVGLSEVQDPNSISIEYKYDSKGRLIQVLDNNGKVIKEYNYNYKN